MTTKREWIRAILSGERGLPVPQHWMSFFNGATARRLTPPNCHYSPMWLYDVPPRFEAAELSEDSLKRMIAFNNQTGRCFACLGVGANIAFGHGGPGEFIARLIKRDDRELIAEYETGVKAKVQFHPHFYHHFDHPVKSMDDLRRLQLPDANEPARYLGFAKNVKFLRERGEFVLGSLNGFFSGIHYFLMDFESTFRALLLEPELIEAILERLGNWNLAAARHMIEAGADGIAICDDLGSKQNMLMAPELYRRYFKPWHRRLCELVHERGGVVHLHSHGAIAPVMNDLAECGFDFVNPFDPEEGWDLEQSLLQYKDRFVLVGGFPTTFWQWDATRQEEFLIKMGALGRRYGRLIFMDSGGVPESVSRADFERITEASRRARGVAEHPGAV